MNETTQASVRELYKLKNKAVIHDTGLAIAEGLEKVDCGFGHRFLVFREFAQENKQKLLELFGALGDAFSDESLRVGIDHDKVGGPIAEEFNGSMLELYALCHVAGIGEVLSPHERRKRGFAKPHMGDADMGIVTLVKRST